jgi:alkylated DNA nucleotide flippase Atl1
VDREEYVDQVLGIVERIPRGRVTTYGAIADLIGWGGPRRVGSVMSSLGGLVPWWRVVRADGTLPLCHDGESRARHLDEGTPLGPTGKVDMAAAYWQPTHERATGAGSRDVG